MTKQEIEAMLKIISVFLGTFLLFSILNGSVTIFMTMGALSVTYLFVHYWEKRYAKKKK
ncbi:MAG: hypothetical protein WC819_04090 [Parcubacteria group bacterium]|jgi:hypothetical protein